MITSVTPWFETTPFPLLSIMAILPLMAMVLVLFLCSAKQVIWLSQVATGLNVILSLYLLTVFDSNKVGVQMAEQFGLFGINYSVGVDGLNILLLPMICVLAWLISIYVSAIRATENRRLLGSVLAYESILIAAFSALNLLQFWLLTVVELVPVLVLVGKVEFDQKKHRLFISLLQFFGSSLLLTLSGFLLLAYGLVDSEHQLSFDWLTLKNNNAYLHDETLIFILLFYGFAIRMPLFPFHGWLPLLVEQGRLTGIVVLLIGMKLGVYATVRFIFPLIPGVAEQWSNFVLLLCLISILYGALLAFMQNNVYRLLAFASVSQTGLLGLGIFSFNQHGLEGTLLLLMVYGFALAGMLFSVGLINKQTRTVFLPRLGGLFDSHTALALLFLVTALSTMIMPGSLGFDAGHLLVEGVIDEHEWLIAITILTANVLAAGFLLWAFQRIFLAESKRHIHYNQNNETVWQERLIALVICGLHIGTGLYFSPLVKLIKNDVADLVSRYPMHSAESAEDVNSAIDESQSSQDEESPE